MEVVLVDIFLLVEVMAEYVDISVSWSCVGFCCSRQWGYGVGIFVCERKVEALSDVGGSRR